MKANKNAIFIESPRFVSYAYYLHVKLGYTVITTSIDVHQHLGSLHIDSFYIPDLWLINILKFKTKFRQIKVKKIVLFSDTSPTSFWVQKNFPTIMVSEDFIYGSGSLFDVNLFSGSKLCTPVKRLFQYISGAKLLHNNKVIYTRSCSIFSSVLFLIWKMVFGYQKVFYTLPGRFSSKVCVHNEKKKFLYLENNFNSSDIIISGPMSMEANKLLISKIGSDFDSNDSNDSNVVLFTQPFYKYPEPRKTMWREEIEHFINDCEKNNQSYCIALHPRDDSEFYLQYVNEEVLINGNRSIAENIRIIQSAGLIVVKSSTVVELAVLMGKPVSYLNYSSYCDINMTKHFYKEMILFQKNSIQDVMSYIKNNGDLVLEHQTAELQTIVGTQSECAKQISRTLESEI